MSQKKIIKKPVSIVILAAIVLFPLLNNLSVFINGTITTAIATHDGGDHIRIVGYSEYVHYTVYEFETEGKIYNVRGATGFTEPKGSDCKVIYSRKNPKKSLVLKFSALYLNPKILLLIFAFVIYFGFEKVLEYNRTYSKNKKVIR